MTSRGKGGGRRQTPAAQRVTDERGRQRRAKIARNPTSTGQGEPRVVIVMSGGSGRTADQVLKAALAQFEGLNVCVVPKSHVNSTVTARKIIREAVATRAIIVHTLVSPKIRQIVIEESERRAVPAIDLLGRLIHALADHLHAKPRNQPGLSYALHKEQFDRIDSVNFTLAHDDGARLSTLHEADVVLVGVSRVAKSVTCFYLAYRGIRAANVPLVTGAELPVELVAFDPQRVIGLTMNVERLRALRSARVGSMGYGLVANYDDRKEVWEEIRYATNLMAKHHWKCLDVSYLSVEEVASEVLRLIELHQ